MSLMLLGNFVSMLLYLKNEQAQIVLQPKYSSVTIQQKKAGKNSMFHSL